MIPGPRGGFLDRREAGRSLAREMAGLELVDPVVVALLRGGAVIGYEIAHEIGAPLYVLRVRKIRAPGQPELALGAVVGSEGGELVLNDDLVRALGVSEKRLMQAIAEARAENEVRRRIYSDYDTPFDLSGRSVIVADDGVATGATFIAAVRALRARQAKKIVAALPVAPPETARRICALCDDCRVLVRPRGFSSVGAYYGSFRAVEDDEALQLLALRRQELVI
ncbi:MAG: phosphoribosyltransferase [Planctomycetes bacterium]|nr:phosphoribosyltransferase [Planctomycetota bacterium]